MAQSQRKFQLRTILLRIHFVEGLRVSHENFLQNRKTLYNFAIEFYLSNQSIQLHKNACRVIYGKKTGKIQSRSAIEMFSDLSPVYLE